MLRITTLAAALLGFAVSPVHSTQAAQGTATVDSVLAKSVEALGGKAALEKIKTRYVKGEMELAVLSLKGPWEVSAKAPNKQVSHVEIAGAGITEEGFDGKVAWAKGPGGAVREKTGEELAKVMRDSDFYRELNVKKLYPDIAHKGTEQFEGEEVSVLESRPSGTSKERFSFSNKTGLLVRQESEFDIGQGKIRLDLRFLDYKPQDGVQFPRRISGHFNVAEQEMEFNVRISEVRFNAPIEDAKFAKPAA
jgi:hypothetical protein